MASRNSKPEIRISRFCSVMVFTLQRYIFRELFRVLQPGGRLVFVTAAQPQSALVTLVSAPWLGRLCFCSNDDLASMLVEAGFQNVQVQRVDRSEHTHSAHELAYAVK